MASPSVQFGIILRDLIKRLERKSRSDIDLANIDRLKKRITLVKSTLGDQLLAMAAPVFVEYAERILEERADVRDQFFTGFDVRAEYVKRKGAIKQSDEFVFALTDSIRAHYIAAGVVEREEIVAEVRKMLTCSLEHTLATSA